MYILADSPDRGEQPDHEAGHQLSYASLFIGGRPTEQAVDR